MSPESRAGRTPDELLAEIKKAEEKTQRGRLKIFLGMCPGVGKTFSMLRSAQEKQSAGRKVVVGLVETHGRAETQSILEGLPTLPRRRLEHKGTLVEEFDLDLALQSKPELILVDELAHSNAPGSRHPKRYQDIRELLFAGIDVYTTMNVQHIESRADLVFQISGVPVRETVPDAFLEFADQIELVDLSPEELLKRLDDGKVYLGDRAVRAAENFFKIEKLTALRELALRFTAEIVDDHLRDHMQTKRILGPWNTNERLMVAVSHSPFSARLIRNTRRTAYNLEAPWVALYVDTGIALTPEDHESLTKNLNLARELGAEVITTQDSSIVEALKRIAAERNVTQIVMGRPDRRFLVDRFGRGTLLDQLVNDTSEVDIHVVRQKRKPVYRGFRIRLPRATSRTGSYGYSVLYIAALALVGHFLRPYVGYRAIGFGFLLGILPISVFAGLGPNFLAAFLSAAIWNFLFIPPLFTLAIGETEDTMMILAYFSVASVAGLLASRVKRQENDLRLRERKSNILYEFGKQLANARGDQEIARRGIESVEAVFPSRVALLRPDPNVANQKLANLTLGARNLTQTPIPEKEYAVASWAFTQQKKAGWRTDTLSSSPCVCFPLLGRTEAVGVLLVYPEVQSSLSLDQENLIETIARHLASSFEREELESNSRAAEIYEQSEKLHQALLNTVSHELRTPLTSILGRASALAELQNSTGLDLHSAMAKEMTTEITSAAQRLGQTIENLMDMSRLSSGVLKLNSHLFELNDFVKSVAHNRHLSASLSQIIVFDLSDDDLFVKGDEKVLEHVIQNLISNAARYSPADSTIRIRSRRNQSYAELSILDEGQGIAPSDLPRIFDRFYRAQNSPPGGVGLGLSITQSLVEAHGGMVLAENRGDRKGAQFTVLLPAQEIPLEALR